MEAKLGECVICERVVVLTRTERCEECFRLEYIVQKDLPGVLKILEQLGMTVLEWIPVECGSPEEWVEHVITRDKTDVMYIDSMANGKWMVEEYVNGESPTHWAKVVLP